MIGRDALIYNVTVAEVMKLKIDKYHTSFLTQMVLRRIKHPEEKMDRIASKTMKMMPKIYTRKEVVEVSSSKCLNQLEEALDKSDSVPQDWITGQMVSHVVKKLVQIVIAKVDGEKQL